MRRLRARRVLSAFRQGSSFQCDWANVTEQTPRQPGMFLENQLLRVSPRELADSDATLAPKLNRGVLERELADVPDEFLVPLLPVGGDVSRQRAAYLPTCGSA